MRSTLTQKLSVAALMCALTAICAQLVIPLPPVPLSLALFAVQMTGALLGARWGAGAVAVYVLLGFAGLPVFAGFRGGPSVLLGPTGGFLAGYIPRRFGRGLPSLALCMIPGTLACCALGAVHFSLISGASLSAAAVSCVLPFLPGDALKILLAAHLCLRLQKPLRALGLS